MNIHPILVHFPIGLLSVYAVLECICFKKVTKQEYWFYVKALFLLIGTLTLIPTGIAGKIIAEHFTRHHAIIDLHATFAATSTLTFGLLSLIYLSRWLTLMKIFSKNSFLYKMIMSIDKYFFKTYITLPIAVLGLILISITGALGAIIVYGPNLDIFTQFIYHIFFHSN